MGLFNQFFSQEKNQDKKSEIWRYIESVTDVEQAMADSKENLVVIFKHSTRCFISRSVLKNFENQITDNEQESIKYYFLDLLSYRDLSNYIAENLNVTHQSPQLIVLKNGEVIHHASHENIDLDNVKNHL